MATAYTPILQLALPVTGELNGTWGDVVNNNITSMVEQAIAGLATVSTWTSASHTLTTANGTTDEARCAVLECSGAPGAAATVICPAFSKVYIIKNSVSGGYAVTLKTSAGAGISVPNGSTALLYCDGTNVVSGANAFTTLTNTGTAYLGGASGNQSLQVNNVASAVNYLQIDGAVSGASPTFSAQGTGSNINVSVTPKGTGLFTVGDSTLPAGTSVLLNALFSSDTASGNVFSVRKSAATTAGANIGLFRSRGTAAAPTALTSGDNINSFAWLGFDGTNYLTAASMISAVDGAVSAGVIYGRISFLTNNGTTNAERGRVDNTGIWTFAGATGAQTLQVNPTASSVNWIQVSGGATGAPPTVLAGGSDTNIDLKLSTTGTGVLQFGTYTAGVVSQAGYITIKDAGGTSRRLLVG